MSTKRSKMKLDGAREILRALADVRDGPFYLLWVDLTDLLWGRLPSAARIAAALPNIEFRIYTATDDANALAVVSVTGKRRDGARLSWGVTVHTGDEFLEITGETTVEDRRESREIFSVTERTGDTARAAELIQSIAAQVCARREGLTADVDQSQTGRTDE